MPEVSKVRPAGQDWTAQDLHEARGKNTTFLVATAVNIIRAKVLNHREFDTLPTDKDVGHGLPQHTEVRSLSPGVY